MDLQHICFIVPNYPYKDEPVYTFARELIWSIADLGIKCTVIATQSVTKRWIRKRKKRPHFWQDITDKNNKIDIYQPSYISFSNLKIFGMSLSSKFSKRAIMNTFDSINIKPDVIYAHFWHCGVIAGIIGQKYNLPVFTATGESKIWVKNLYKEKKVNEYLKDTKGVICVSTKNMKESLKLKLAPKEKMTVIPNGIDTKKFYPMRKKDVRKKLGFKEEDYILVFTGSFSHRKGVLRLSKAIQKLENVKSIYIGSGKLIPNNGGILFMGRLPHEEIVYYLNAADIFVLPTLAEGCCNAIIEAMACGLPIISSDLSFNDDILNDKNSIRVDSNDIKQIANAIQYLRDNFEIRDKMSKASMEKAKELDINERAKKIIKYIRMCSEEQK